MLAVLEGTPWDPLDLVADDTVVDIEINSVVTFPTGQLVTLGGHDVTV